jgi:hypothetical protein
MTLAELAKKLGLRILNEMHDKDVEGAFVSDMVSDVMAGAKPGNLWVTTQTHKNIVAAANLVDISGIVVTRKKAVPKETLEMADRAELTILAADLETYSVVGTLHAAGVK